MHCRPKSKQLSNIPPASAEILPKLVSNFFKFSRICCRWCRVRRRDQESSQITLKISKDSVGRETYMPSDQVKTKAFLFHKVETFLLYR